MIGDRDLNVLISPLPRNKRAKNRVRRMFRIRNHPLPRRLLDALGQVGNGQRPLRQHGHARLRT
jgi:hypothetical protein